MPEQNPRKRKTFKEAFSENLEQDIEDVKDIGRAAVKAVKLPVKILGAPGRALRESYPPEQLVEDVKKAAKGLYDYLGDLGRKPGIGEGHNTRPIRKPGSRSRRRTAR